jgi:NAD(P)-dependent dehydrogenase (short-subunit alcohol dehydrogenase family)
MSKIWFITGVSRGFGRNFAEAALERGDQVAATARDVKSLQPLVEKHGAAILPLALDVTDRAAARAAVQQAFDRFGRLDVVVNNAGYGHFGFLEEVTEAEARAQLETNLFGAMWVTQAAVPLLRKQGSGHVIQISSVGGVGAFPGLGLYHASKWALEGFSEALAKEVASFGIKVTIVEPGGFSTDWSGSSSAHSQANPAYDPVREARLKQFGKATIGDPTAAAQSLLAVVDAKEPPLRILFGNNAFDMVPAIYQERLRTWAAWEKVSRDADGKK